MSQSHRASAAQAAWKLFDDPEFVREVKEVLPTTLRTLLAAAREIEVPQQLLIVMRYQVGRKQLRSTVGTRLSAALEAEAKAAGGDDSAAVARMQAFLGYVVQLHRAVLA